MENLMKRNILITFVLVISVNISVFSHTAVTVPDSFVGTWWMDISEAVGALDGLQFLAGVEIKKDGTWISSAKFVAYNQAGLSFLKESGYANGQSLIIESGFVTGATSVEIILTKLGEKTVHDRFTLDGNDILDSQRNRFTRDEPQVRKQ
jgi:hypothetical protein